MGTTMLGAENKPADARDAQQSAQFPGGQPPGIGRGMGTGTARFRGEAQKPRDASATVRRILAYLGKERASIAGVFMLAALETTGLLLAPRLIGMAVDSMGQGLSLTPLSESMHPLQNAVVALAGAYLVIAVVSFAQAWIVAGASQRMAGSLRAGLFDKLGALPLAYLDSAPRGDIMSRIANDCDAVGMAVSQSAVQLATGTASVCGALVMMIILNPVLALVTLASAPLVFLLSKLIALKSRPFYKRQREALGALNTTIEESASGLDTIRAFGMEHRMEADFAVANARLREAGTRSQIWTGFLMPMLGVINNITFAGIALTGGYLAAQGGISIGVIASFIAYSRQFVRPLNELANLASSLMSALAGAERVFEILDEAEQSPDITGALAVDSVQGHVEFRGVGFSYKPGQPVLADIDIVAPAGSMTAIVGPTGAGKTTIANLLARFYDPDPGTVLMDGIDARSYRRADYLSRFGVVLQDAYLFPGSVRDNIRYARPDADDDAILAACAVVGALPFIERLPGGLDAAIGEGDSGMSHGQLQLLAIARAALAAPDVLILDEATGALDTRTEIHVQRGLRTLMAGRTTFVIAHRLRTIREADLILVVDHGRIIESGTHLELLATQGLYRRMYEAQIGGRE